MEMSIHFEQTVYDLKTSLARNDIIRSNIGKNIPQNVSHNSGENDMKPSNIDSTKGNSSVKRTNASSNISETKVNIGKNTSQKLC